MNKPTDPVINPAETTQVAAKPAGTRKRALGVLTAVVVVSGLAWGGYELWSLRRWRERDRQAREAEDASEAPPSAPSVATTFFESLPNPRPSPPPPS